MKALLVLTLILVVGTVGYGVYAIKNSVEGKTVKRFLGVNISTFFIFSIATVVALLSSGSASAAETAAAIGATTGDGLKYMAAALSTGLACIGTGIAVSASAAAAIGAISEDAKLLGKTIIFVGLSEGIAIYGLIISIMILGQ